MFKDIKIDCKLENSTIDGMKNIIYNSPYIDYFSRSEIEDFTLRKTVNVTEEVWDDINYLILFCVGNCV